MPLPIRIAYYTIAGSLLLASAGCCCFAPRCSGPSPLRQCQLRGYELHQQSLALAQQRDAASQMVQTVTVEKQQLAHQKQQLAEQNVALQAGLEVSNQRLANMQSEREKLKERYLSLLNKQRDAGSPLADETTRRFEELARKYPEFEFDPVTGVSKFHSDILFESGSDQVKTGATPLLREFAEIMNGGQAQRLNILVVGHTDDKPIKHTRAVVKNPTNWHLSTNRANSVVLTLRKLGLDDDRMGAAGYSKYQPVRSNTNEVARQLNRRVEIFVLAPDALVAGGWDPAKSRK